MTDVAPSTLDAPSSPIIKSAPALNGGLTIAHACATSRKGGYWM